MKYLRVTMPDGSKWDVPASIIEDSYFSHYDDEERYELNAFELKDWAANNMNWHDVSDRAKQVSEPRSVDYQEGWMNGPKEIVEVP